MRQGSQTRVLNSYSQIGQGLERIEYPSWQLLEIVETQVPVGKGGGEARVFWHKGEIQVLLLLHFGGRGACYSAYIHIVRQTIRIAGSKEFRNLDGAMSVDLFQDKITPSGSTRSSRSRDDHTKLRT